jgi:hypothetical protein
MLAMAIAAYGFRRVDRWPWWASVVCIDVQPGIDFSPAR